MTLKQDLKVLVLIDAFRMGGAETLLAPLAVALGKRGVEVDFVSVLSPAADAAKTTEILAAAGVTTRGLGVKRLVDPTAVPRVVQEIRRGGYDVVHAHLEMATILAAAAAPLARRPAVCTFHHVARPLTGRPYQREKLAVAAATRTFRSLFVSEASRAAFGELYRAGDIPANWDVMHNGIDIADFAPGQPDPAVRAALMAPDIGSLDRGSVERPLVVLPAAFRDFKGHPIAIAAWPRVLERFPDAMLALVGGGESEPELRAQVAAAGLDGSIVFAGVRSDMPAIYRSADAVLLPSTHGENLPTVLIEASATGVPLAASRVGGIADIVQDNVTGVLFEPNNPAALADSVIALLDDPEMAAELGRAAIARARTEFSADAWAARLHALYSEACGHDRTYPVGV